MDVFRQNHHCLPTLAWIILKFVYLLQKGLIIAVIVDASSGIKEIKKSRTILQALLHPA